jgi:CubicO group peptidase (beta-lactamase class C family)
MVYSSKTEYLTMKYSLIIVALSIWVFPLISQSINYFPERGAKWDEKAPSDLQLDEVLLQEAIAFAKANEYSEPHDLQLAIYKSFAHEPYHKILGLTRDRGEPAGMIIKDGYLVASWGDTKRVDMTFSVTKSYLSTMAAIALQDGFIGSLDDKVDQYVWDGLFDGDHNSKITWRHLLTQSSDWSGELWGGKDWADRPAKEGNVDDWKFRKLHEPGTNFEYNDVRVNLLSYSLMQVHRKPLPIVLKERVMDPIGASSTWRWHGYHNSWVEIDGLKMQSVSGGGHSGGGLFINTEDHARFGLLFLNNGKWKDQQIIQPSWIKAMTQSSVAEDKYGFMWWLNPEGSEERMTAISHNAYYAAGFGGNYIIVEPDHNMVIVLRWLQPAKANEFISLLKKAIK